jgi:hypothetical protein
MMTAANKMRSRRWLWLWTVCYLVLAGAIVGSLFYARERVRDESRDGALVSNWQAWRQDVEKHEERLGPVERRVPKSAEPPALVLMRDYFGVCLGGAIVFSTVLYWVIAWLVTGAVVSAPARGATDRNNRPPR